jgi:hypothetical protein
MSTRPISRTRFLWRLAKHGLLSLILVTVVLWSGIAGYQHYEHLSARDAFLNAAMLLGGMGPVYTNFSSGGKVFAGFYAMFCGLLFIAVIGIIATPVVHRMLHRFHWEEDDSPAGG